MLIGILDLRSFVWNFECWNCLAWKLQCWEWILQLKLLWLSSSCFSARYFFLLLLWELDNQVPLAGGLEMRRLTVFWSWSGYRPRWSRHWHLMSMPNRNLYHLQIHLLQHLLQVPLQVVLLQCPLQMCPYQVPQRLPPRLLQATWEHAQFVGKKRIGEMGAAWIQPALQPGVQ